MKTAIPVLDTHLPKHSIKYTRVLWTHEMPRASQASQIVWVRTRVYFIGNSVFKVLPSDMPLEGIDTVKMDPIGLSVND
jgi:hypothetical protein